MNETLMLVVGLLSEQEPRNTGPDFGKASPIGLLIVVLLIVGTFFLIWSMNRHLRKLPKSFDRDSPERGRIAGDETVDPGITDRTEREQGG